MFQNDAFHNVGNILAYIDGFFNAFKYFLPFYQFDGIFFMFEEIDHRRSQDNVAFVLERVDFHACLHDHLGIFHVSHGMDYEFHLLDSQN